MKPPEIKEVLKKHRKWLANEKGGEKADLTGANLTGADLRVANLPSASKWLKDNFSTVKSGYIVYKTFGAFNAPPDSWEIKRGCVITDIPNYDRTEPCSWGINFATLDWIKAQPENNDKEI